MRGPSQNSKPCNIFSVVISGELFKNTLENRHFSFNIVNVVYKKSDRGFALPIQFSFVLSYLKCSLDRK